MTSRSRGSNEESNGYEVMDKIYFCSLLAETEEVGEEGGSEETRRNDKRY